MKKILILVIMIFSVLLVVGCEPQDATDEEVVFGEDGALAGQAVAAEKVQCKRNADCRAAVLACFRDDCPNLRGAQRTQCINDCYDEALAQGERQQAPPFVVGVSENGPARDNILVTNVVTALTEDGFEFEPGLTRLFSEIEGTDLDNQVTMLVFNGEARLIVGDNSPATHTIFMTKVGEELVEQGVEIEGHTLLSSEVDSNNLMALFLRPTPEFVAAVDDNGPASDNLFLTDVFLILEEQGYDINDVSMLFSEVEGNSLDNQVTLVISNGRARVVVGENSPATHTLFATNVAQAIADVQSRNLVRLSSEVDQDDLETVFGR